MIRASSTSAPPGLLQSEPLAKGWMDRNAWVLKRFSLWPMNLTAKARTRTGLPIQLTVELGVLVPYPEDGSDARDHRRPSALRRTEQRDGRQESIC